MATQRRSIATRAGNAGSPWTRWVARGTACLTPWGVRSLVHVRWALVAPWLLLSVGFAVQLVVVGMVYELVDLCISLAELWTELARKHLEITL
jgi:hypothetical protein